MSTPDKLRIDELLLKSLEEDITAEEFAELNRLLTGRPDNQAYYGRAVNTCLKLYECGETLTDFEAITDPVLEEELWKRLAENEKNAPAEPIKITEEIKAVKVGKSEISAVARQPSRTSFYAAAAAMAALVFLLIYLNFVSSQNVMDTVATVVDSIQPHAAGKAGDVEHGSRLSPSQGPIMLTKGILKLQFDNQAVVVVEAPARFKVMTADQIHMDYGRLYAVVPPEAMGFTVTSQTSRIIDLGTEFGVEVAPDRTTELHVLKGKTTLVSGEKANKKSMPVGEGQARKISGSSASVTDITCDESLFVRNIDSVDNLVWRGQKIISLADVIGGGSGFGSGRLNAAIRPDGTPVDKPEYRNRRQANAYLPVSSNPLLDGVFVPNGAGQVVTSSGLRFEECPPTSGSFFADIVNTPRLIRSLTSEQELPAMLGEVNYSLAQNPSILLHANLGVTFDLDAFRSRLPGAEISEFTCEFGISDSTPRSTQASFWVLVDGQVRCYKWVETRGLADRVRIQIEDGDRFLTLMATDGSEAEPEIPRDAIGYDWCIFGDPFLRLR